MLFDELNLAVLDARRCTYPAIISEIKQTNYSLNDTETEYPDFLKRQLLIFTARKY